MTHLKLAEEVPGLQGVALDALQLVEDPDLLGSLNPGPHLRRAVADEAAFMAQLPEQDRIPFRNLALIRPQAPTEGQLQLVESLARNLASPRLLTLIARTPHWLVSGPVLQALAGNEATPEPLRRDLELAVSLFDLMRDLDRAPAGERRSAPRPSAPSTSSCPWTCAPIVKQQAKQLARSVHASGQTLELPPLPAGEQDWEALTTPPRRPGGHGGRRSRLPRLDLLARAESTPILEDLQGFLLDADAELRAAALRNPALSEEVLLAAFPRCAVPELFEDIYAEARWYFRDPLREAIYASPCCPLALARKMAGSRDLVALLEQGSLDGTALHRVVSLFHPAGRVGVPVPDPVGQAPGAQHAAGRSRSSSTGCSGGAPTRPAAWAAEAGRRALGLPEGAGATWPARPPSRTSSWPPSRMATRACSTRRWTTPASPPRS